MRYKCKILFSLLVACGIAASASAQKVTLSLQKVSLETALAEITKQANVTFAYSQPVIDPKTEVSVDVKDVELPQALDRLLAGTNIAYEINGRKVLLFSRQQATSAQPQPAGESVVTVTGVVADAVGVMAGASVKVKGSTKGTLTDASGRFSLLGVDAQGVLEVSFMGYSTKEIAITGRTWLEVMLEEDERSISEVVVIGYGSQRKRDLTGSVASIKGDDLPKTANTTLGQILKGQIPGLSYTQTSSQPGAAVWMRIRGAAAGASPLIVVDGIPVSTMWEPDPGLNFGKGDKESVLDNINPDDVQDIQVLKDASATSIYGSRAAGGVILITTKKGAEGDKLDVSLKTSYTTQWIAEQPEVMEPKAYMQASNASQLERWLQKEGYYPWGVRPLPDGEDAVHKLYENAGMRWNYAWDEIDAFTGGTDWYDALTRRGAVQQYDLSITGGGKKSGYLISLGHMGNDGIVKNNDYSRTTGRISLDQTFNKWLKGGITASYALVKSDDVPLSGASGTTTLFMAARKYDPTIPIRDENGNFALGKIFGLAQNPASVLEAAMLTKKDNILTSAYLDIMPIDGLVLKTTVGFDRKFATTGAYFPMTTQEGINANGGIAKISDNNLSNYYVNPTATYNKTFADDHTLGVMVGWEYQEVVSESLSGENRGFPYDGVRWHNLALGTYEKPIVTSGKSTTQNASFLSRLNYSYKGRYLLTANFRRDGSSNFAANRQWGNFGGVSVAWRISDEALLRDVSWLSNLKLRGGMGITGYAGSLTGTQTYYTPGKDYYFGNKHTSGVALAALGNPDLSWESQQDVNVALDFGFFKNKLGGSVDIYERTINDRIGTKNLMSYHEVNTLNYNTQRVDKTRGLDLSLYGTVVSAASFSWRSSLTFTYYKDYASKRDPSEILDINTPARNADWNDVWSYLSDGLIQPGEVVPHMPGAGAGVIKLLDLNGYLYDNEGVMVRDADGRPMYLGEPDGKLDNADLVVVYNSRSMPVSWTNTFAYKNFDLNIYLYGKFNHYKNTDYLVNIAYGPYEGTNTSPYFNDRFTWSNTTSTIPAFTRNTQSSWGYGDYFMEKAWFIRVDNISLGYTLPKSITRSYLQSLRVYVALKNIFTITPYGGYDPEYDVYSYPSVSGCTFGLDIKF